MKTSVRRGLLFGLPCLVIAAVVSYWGYQYSTHSTPQKAQATYDAAIGPFETVKFAKGVVLFTPGKPGILAAWYMTRNLWGWHVKLRSEAARNLSPQNYKVDFESFTADGKTLVWGTNMAPMKKIVFTHNGKTYTCPVGKQVWYMVLPFPISEFPHSEWSMVLPNGETAPLFKR